jgi:hypothetical protein
VRRSARSTSVHSATIVGRLARSVGSPISARAGSAVISGGWPVPPLASVAAAYSWATASTVLITSK